MVDFDLRPAFIFVLIVGALFVASCWFIVDFFLVDHGITSDTLITPEIRLTIKNNVVDTIYYYRKP